MPQMKGFFQRQIEFMVDRYPRFEKSIWPLSGKDGAADRSEYTPIVDDSVTKGKDG